MSSLLVCVPDSPSRDSLKNLKSLQSVRLFVSSPEAGSAGLTSWTSSDEELLVLLVQDFIDEHVVGVHRDVLA